MEEAYRDLLEKINRLETLLHRYQGYRCRNGEPFANPLRGQGRVLSILKMMSKISQKELAYLLDMRQQSLSELLQKLERSGLITRIPSEEDKRVYTITLTERGKSFSDHMGDMETGADNVFDCLSKEEQEKLREFLDRLADSLDRKMKAEVRDEDPMEGHGFGGHWRHGRHDFSFYWDTDPREGPWEHDRPCGHRHHPGYWGGGPGHTEPQGSGDRRNSPSGAEEGGKSHDETDG
ncbi:Transcriptional regulator SlyA [bioreactor metagenome]|uniref:Transcriptional regulator SlyA n=1 Tax=bioreactor metagenome TaxID=1076179 RepID=A0A645A2H7_9ZZZZ